RFCACAMPFSRSSVTAASMSPFVSWSARLQSIIPAPVRSRSSLTSAAEISAIGLVLRRLGGCLGGGLGFSVRGRLGCRSRGGLGLGGHRCGVGLRGRLGCRRTLDRLALALAGGGRCRCGAVLLLREVAGGDLLLPVVDGLGDPPRDEPAR